MKLQLILYAALCLISPAHCAGWEKSRMIAGVAEWSPNDLGPLLRLTKERNQSGAYYRLDLIQTDGRVLDVSMPGPNTWIDSSWAGLAWLSDAEFAWLDDRYIFFQNGLFLAIFDIFDKRFPVNNQTEFLAKIGEFRWFYVAYRGKNHFSDLDILGVVGVGLLKKANTSVPPGFDGVAVINRVGRSVTLDGLLIAPPVPGRDSVWLLVASDMSTVAIQQYKLPSMNKLSSINVAKSVPRREILIRQSRDGDIPKNGAAVLGDLLPIQDVTSWDQAADWFLDTTK